MIKYESGLLGLGSLSRVHGSAAYKVIIPSLLSTGVFFGYHYFPFVGMDEDEKVIQHPYTIGAFLAFFTLLLTFRLNFAYGRYWEGATAIHAMLSRWLDCGITLAAFHYQSDQYDAIAPPSFGDIATKYGIISASKIDGRDRNYPGPASFQKASETIQQIIMAADKNEKQQQRQSGQVKSSSFFFFRRRWDKNKNNQTSTSNDQLSGDNNNPTNAGSTAQMWTKTATTSNNSHQTNDKMPNSSPPVSSKRPATVRRVYSVQSTPKSINKTSPAKSSSNFHDDGDDDEDDSLAIPVPVRFQDQQPCASSSAALSSSSAGGMPSTKPDITNTMYSFFGPKSSSSFRKKKHRRHASKIPAPSLFLQETAHLLSLLSSVAMSTLRNDIEGAESPITEYIPGKPWPPVDSFFLDTETRAAYNEASVMSELFFYMLGLSRSTRHRTLYNAARPFGVLGGVSDEEIHLLQTARGPYAKVALVSLWVQEFISREHLNGSTGDVPATIVTRVYQMLSDGLTGYNQARKIAYVPYPFPNAQIASFFSLAIIFVLPLLYDSYVTRLWFAAIMNFTTVLCFLGLHEVARELEAPFQNVPNDLPLTTFQAQFNEALITMYAGFHPDSWWTVNHHEYTNHGQESQIQQDQSGTPEKDNTSSNHKSSSNTPPTTVNSST